MVACGRRRRRPRDSWAGISAFEGRPAVGSGMSRRQEMTQTGLRAKRARSPLVVNDRAKLIHLLDIRQTPAFVEVGFQRPVESETREPCSARHGRNPVLLQILLRG